MAGLLGNNSPSRRSPLLEPPSAQDIAAAAQRRQSMFAHGEAMNRQLMAEAQRQALLSARKMATAEEDITLKKPKTTSSSSLSSSSGLYNNAAANHATPALSNDAIWANLGKGLNANGTVNPAMAGSGGSMFGGLGDLASSIGSGASGMLGNVASGIGGAASGLGSAATGLLGSFGSGLAGAGSAAASGIGGLLTGLLALSDEDEKTNIQKLGKDGDTGIDLYAYDYKSDVKAAKQSGKPMPPKRVGPMAQDVEKKAPKAVKKVGGKRVIRLGGR